MTAAKRPLYFRLLRVQHLTMRPWQVFLLFEGSIGLGGLLALADIVSPWGVLAIPVAVAAMVKINDVISAAMLEPMADAQLRTPGILPRRASGHSPVPRTGRVTARIEEDDAIADPAARPDGVARGVARPRYRGIAPAGGSRRLPRPGIQTPEAPIPEHTPVETIVNPVPRRREGADRRSRGNQGRFE